MFDWLDFCVIVEMSHHKVRNFSLSKRKYLFQRIFLGREQEGRHPSTVPIYHPALKLTRFCEG